MKLPHTINQKGNLHLTLPKEKITTIVGPTGCGKSTTLKLINRLIEPSDGKIFIDEMDISQMDSVNLRRNIGYLIQQIGLFPHILSIHFSQEIRPLAKVLIFDIFIGYSFIFR